MSGIVPSLKVRIHGFDELRGLAILSVLLAHFLSLRSRGGVFGDFELGAIGVDLFFVISGYLIGRILLESRGDPDYYRRFYVRRAFRILPLYTAVLLLGLARQGSLAYLPYYLTFTQNFLPPGQGIADAHPTWSLAVEEHFYLAMPILIATLPRPRLAAVLVALGVAGVGLRAWAVGPLEGADWLHYGNPHATWCRLQYLCLGVLLNLERPLLHCGTILLAAAATLLYAPRGLLDVVCLALMVLASAACIQGRPWVRNRVLAHLGRLCLGLYLLHLPVRLTLLSLEARYPAPSLAWFGVYMLLTVGMAALSYRYFELPVMRLRTLWESSSTAR